MGSSGLPITCLFVRWLAALLLLVPAAQAFFQQTPRIALAPRTLPPFVVLPGFGNDANDYLIGLTKRGEDKGEGEGGGEDKSFVTALRKRGITVAVVPVERRDWFKVAKGVFNLSFWQGNTSPSELAYGWYLDKVYAEIDRVRAETGSQKVVLCGHSAGGWLGRAILGSGEWAGSAATRTEDVVAGLVSLGSPHSVGPNDMTRGALTYVEANFPGAFLPGVSYVSVAGTALEGKKDAEKGDRRKFAYSSYLNVAGVGDVVGDGVVPLQSAHLEGAAQVTLPGVFHSIDQPSNWYGSPEKVDLWLPTVYAQLKRRGR